MNRIALNNHTLEGVTGGHNVKYVSPVLLTIGITTVVFTLVAGTIGYIHFIIDESPLVQEHGTYRPLNFKERFDYFAWEACMAALPVAALITIGVAVCMLPISVIVARCRWALAYASSALAGALLTSLVSLVAARYLYGHWPQPSLNMDWAGVLGGGAFCGAVLTLLVRRAAAMPSGMVATCCGSDLDQV